MTTIDRIQELLEHRNIPKRGMRRALERTCGISYQAVSQWFTGETSNIKNEHLAAIAQEYGSSLDWLISGKGPMIVGQAKAEDSAAPKENHTQLETAPSDQPKEGGGNVITADFQKARLREGEITIPQFDVRGAMGAGQVAPDYVETIRHLTLHQDYLSALGVRYTQASNLAIVTGYGQSMEGTINDGDPVIIDRGVQTFMGDGVYLLTWNDMLYIKRLQMVSATEIELISDNPKHKDRVVKLDEVTVHAKVLIAWNARKL